MPELPEVEVAKYALAKILVGKKLLWHISFTEKLRFTMPSEKQFQDLYNKLITKVVRKAKTLYIIFETGTFLSIHFGMTGFLESDARQHSTRGKHEHIRLKFTQNTWLSYFDSRRFGNISISNLIPKAAIDPLAKDFTSKLLFNLISNKKSCIKAILMNQSYIAGIGNIYANEALFLAKILPYTPANKLSFLVIKKLVKSIRYVLQESIDSGRNQFDKINQIDNQLMKFPTKAKVYLQKDMLCPICKITKIQSIIINGRNSFFCNSCQN